MLRGGGHEGRGEDVTYVAEDHDGFPLDLPLAGTWTIDAFSERIGGLDLFPAGGPTMAGQETYRRWAFESAALDLALRQAGRSLGAALGLDVPSAALRRLDAARHHAVAGGRPVARVQARPDAGLGRREDGVRRRDGPRARPRLQVVLRGHARWTTRPTRRSTRRSRGRSRTPSSRTRRWRARRATALNGQEDRFSFDAPIHSWADVEAVAARAGLGGRLPRFLNIKPSRFGSLRALLDCVARAQAAGIVLYGGGQFELGVGRDHIQALASLLYADGPNDVAPRDFHGEPRPGVPRSPLVPLEQRPGWLRLRALTRSRQRAFVPRARAPCIVRAGPGDSPGRRRRWRPI